jgi:hypothetical protein
MSLNFSEAVALFERFDIPVSMAFNGMNFVKKAADIINACLYGSMPCKVIVVVAIDEKARLREAHVFLNIEAAAQKRDELAMKFETVHLAPVKISDMPMALGGIVRLADLKDGDALIYKMQDDVGDAAQDLQRLAKAVRFITKKDVQLFAIADDEDLSQVDKETAQRLIAKLQKVVDASGK